MIEAAHEAWREIAKQFAGPEKWWFVIGFIGQFVFTARFIVQWIASEREGRSIMPVAFWFLSIGGSMTILIYAIHRRDPVIILGQAFGSFVYFRNLMLVYKEKMKSAEAAE